MLVWHIRGPEFFTEFKKFALLRSIGLPKLRVFCEYYRKLGRNYGEMYWKMYQNIANFYPKKSISSSTVWHGIMIFGQNVAKNNWEKNVGSGFLNYSFFPDFWAILRPIFVIFQKNCPKIGQKSGKNEKIKNPLPTFFFNYFWPYFGQKLRSQVEQLRRR